MLIAIQQQELALPVMLDTIPTEVSAHYVLLLQIVLIVIQQREIVPLVTMDFIYLAHHAFLVPLFLIVTFVQARLSNVILV